MCCIICILGVVGLQAREEHTRHLAVINSQGRQEKFRFHLWQQEKCRMTIIDPSTSSSLFLPAPRLQPTLARVILVVDSSILDSIQLGSGLDLVHSARLTARCPFQRTPNLISIPAVFSSTWIYLMELDKKIKTKKMKTKIPDAQILWLFWKIKADIFNFLSEAFLFLLLLFLASSFL